MALPAAVVALSVGEDCKRSARAHRARLVPAWCRSPLYERWVALALPIVAGGFLVLTLAALPFNSAALIVDVWTSAAMFILSLPRHGHGLASRRPPKV